MAWSPGTVCCHFPRDVSIDPVCEELWQLRGELLGYLLWDVGGWYQPWPHSAGPGVRAGVDRDSPGRLVRFSLVTATSFAPPPRGRLGSGLEQDLHRVVFLLLEDLISVRALLKRQLVGVKAFDPEGITVASDQRHYVFYPALDVGLTHGQLHLLVEERQHWQRISHPPIDTDEGDRPAPPDRVDGQVEGVQAVGSGLLHHLLRHRVGHEGRHLLGEACAGGAVSLHPYRVYDRVGASPFPHLADLRGNVVVLAKIEHLDAIASGPLKAFGHQVHRDDTIAKVLGDAAGHVSDRTEAKRGNTATLGDVGGGGRPARRWARRQRGRRSARLVDLRGSLCECSGSGGRAGARPVRRQRCRRAWYSRTAQPPCPPREPASSRTGSVVPDRT